MSLVTEAMGLCTLLVMTTTPDGRGGVTASWTDGESFYAAIAFNSSIEARHAEGQEEKGLYSVITARAVTLHYHDVFRRESDEKIFRVTRDGADKKTPPSAGLDMREVSAEEWALPVGM